jgi:uncharacterized membrane protein (UPF0127 family)
MIYSLTEKLFLKMAKTNNISSKTIFSIKSNKYKFFFLAVFVVLAITFVIVFILPTFNKQPTACFNDNYCVNIEIKDTYEEREVGLMYRENLNENQGMLFVFEQPSRYTFWMKNMLIYIDIIYLDSNITIVDIFQKVPPCVEEPCELYTPSSEALYVIETKSGFSERHQLKIGQSVEIKR